MASVSANAEHEIKLGFGGEQLYLLVASGVFGMIPACTWLMMLMLPFDFEHARHSQLVDVAGGAAMMFLMVIAPWLAALLILRARQPLGARLTWNSEVLIEWDGPDRRTVIPWRAAVACEREWVIQYRTGPRTERAIQVFDPNTKNAITVWTTRPRGAPLIRRRLTSAHVSRVRTAVVTHGVELTGEPDWSRAFEPGRPPHEGWSRLGYVFAVFAPLVMPVNFAVGIALSTLAAALLTLRARPVFRELTALGDSPWDQRKRRAVVAEALIRSTFVALVIYSAWAAHAFLKPD